MFHSKNRLRDRARDFYEESREAARDGASEASGFIHERPLASTLIGLGAGVLFGMIYGGFRKPAPTPRPMARRKRKTARA